MRIKSLVYLFYGLAFGLPAQAALNDGSCTDAQSTNITTAHTGTINGHPISYSANTGFIEVTSADKTAKACIFYTAYTVPAAAGQSRALTFAFNGGPGSSSVWLHLGLLGPERVNLGEDGLGSPSGAPNLVPNDSSLLDVSDLVILDPVATGFSHTENSASGDPFFGVKNDYTSIAQFVRNYLNIYNRWTSPLYVLGESYGGIRGPLLVNYLQNSMQIRVAGLILVSPALSHEMFFSAPDAIVPYVTYFPSFAATAWYHHTIAPQYNFAAVDQVFQRAKEFAETRLQASLMKGGDIEPQERDDIAQEIADFTGLSKTKVLEVNLRIDPDTIFRSGISGNFLGRYDSRYLQPAAGDYLDPSATIPGFAFAAGINEYLRTQLSFPSPNPYNIWGDLTGWPDDPAASDLMPTVASSLAADPNFKVLVASGYYDLACPMESVAFELRQLKNSINTNARVFQKLYPSGHMIYLNPIALPQLKADISAFMGMH